MQEQIRPLGSSSTTSFGGTRFGRNRDLDISTGGATVTDPSDPNSTVTGFNSRLKHLPWTIDNAPFVQNSNFDEVDITTNVLPTASIGSTTEICNGNSTTFNGSVHRHGTLHVFV
ncbi:MAG: hypothetical protein IPL22_16095 [Bacteroidetes bacterium]|nr:hypothetical protein [Bacteroidota bacterium]